MPVASVVIMLHRTGSRANDGSRSAGTYFGGMAGDDRPLANGDGSTHDEADGR
jgi:hypothetical protein